MSNFKTTLATVDENKLGGFGLSGFIDPVTWADELYKGKVSGPLLCCYMIRRFGWPNTSSDPYKKLCSWMLTTPMDGLFLEVMPYLGSGQHNLHFGIGFTEPIGRQIIPRDESSFNLQVRDAIKATLADLLRPTYVRDIYFNPIRTGDDLGGDNMAEPFNGAGFTPEYWFTRATKEEREGKL